MNEVHISVNATSAEELHDTLRELCKNMLGTHESKPKSEKEIALTAHANGYADGMREAKSEMQQEKAMRPRNIVEMLQYETVTLQLHAGHMPFLFKPYCVSTFGKLPTLLLLSNSEAPEYLTGTAPETVGVYGHNLVTNRSMFVTKYYVWKELDKLVPNA